MKKATKRKIILSGILFHMILVFTACGLCNKATFIGDEISDTDFYDIAFEQMNSTHSHNIDMDAGESITVKIISKSGKISVQIYDEDDQPVYRGDDVTDATLISGAEGACLFWHMVLLYAALQRQGTDWIKQFSIR